MTGHESAILVGLSVNINCSTHLQVTRLEWLQVGVADPVEEREDGGQLLVLPLSPNTTELNGTMFVCRVTSISGYSYEKTITVTVKGKMYVAFMCLVQLDSIFSPIRK